MGEPEDVSGLVAFLASDEARYITGSTFYVDVFTLMGVCYGIIKNSKYK